MKINSKSEFSWLIGLLLILPLSHCVEIGPAITLVDVKPLRDTTYVDNNLPAPQHRKVLFEEFTGVHCPNCPAGHQLAHDIEQAHPDSVILVAMHNFNSQAKPFDGEEDFRTTEGGNISDLVGGTSGIPAAAVDRRLFSGQTQIAWYTPYWIDFVNQEIQQSVSVNVDLGTAYNDASRELRVSLKLHFLQDVDSTTNLSIYIVESDIVSPQLLQDGHSVDSNYVHNHILRGFVNEGPFGKALTPSTEKGRVFEKDFAYTLPADWNADNCEVVAFVHFHGDSEQVLQANSAPVK